MKTIEDAVIRFNGVWQECFDIGCAPLGLTREQFESEAKRLGYISGYRWGIEYPTNGKRPELADGTIVEARYPDGDWHEDGEDDVFDFLWKAFSHFRITDQRYKPADTSYLNQCKYSGVADVDQLKVKCMHLIDDKPVDELAVSNSSIDGIHAGDKISIEGLKRVNLSWHDRGELPPVGWTGELSPYWHACEVVAHHNGAAVVWDAHDLKYIRIKNTTLFRPIRTEREKVIEAAVKLLEIKHGSPWSLYKKYAESLYNAGMLVLPPKKSDTED